MSFTVTLVVSWKFGHKMDSHIHFSETFFCNCKTLTKCVSFWQFSLWDMFMAFIFLDQHDCWANLEWNHSIGLLHLIQILDADGMNAIPGFACVWFLAPKADDWSSVRVVLDFLFPDVVYVLIEGTHSHQETQHAYCHSAMDWYITEYLLLKYESAVSCGFWGVRRTRRRLTPERVNFSHWRPQTWIIVFDWIQNLIKSDMHGFSIYSSPQLGFQIPKLSWVFCDNHKVCQPEACSLLQSGKLGVIYKD